MRSQSPVVTPGPFDGFLDDLRPVDAPCLDSPYVGLRAVRDVDLPGAPAGLPLRVVLTGGAAQVDGPLALCERRGLVPAALDTALRDPGDLAGNARRVTAALTGAGPPDGVVVHVRVPGAPTPGAVAALDELALVEAVLALPPDAEGLEAWLDAALDREVRVSLVGGTPGQAVTALETVARLWGDEGDLVVARRFVGSWLTEDPGSAIAHLAAL